MNGSTPLFRAALDERCITTVILPSKDEEALLPAALGALARQRSLDGRPLDPSTYEVLVLLNNTSDHSFAAVRKTAERLSQLRLQVAECELPSEMAHVGTARRMLMDAACARLTRNRRGQGLILSTDADTEVAEDWVAQNNAAVQSGADAVGGVIELAAAECERLQRSEPELLRAYRRDRRYQQLVARLENELDPDLSDPWPRHLENFGASLGCTTEIYQRAGGLPAVSPLEDLAFVKALRRVDARLRHAPGVRVRTSGRLDGRAEVGLSSQLRRWRSGEGQRVPGRAWLAHRLQTMAALRGLHAGKGLVASSLLRAVATLPELEELLRASMPVGEFLERIDAEAIAAKTYSGNFAAREMEITSVIADLERWPRPRVPADRDETELLAVSGSRATQAG